MCGEELEGGRVGPGALPGVLGHHETVGEDAAGEEVGGHGVVARLPRLHLIEHRTCRT